MVDQVTTVTKRGWFSRIGSSFQGIVFGFILFIAAFGVLYWNEGRVDTSEIAKTAITIDAETPNTSANGQLVTTTGKLTSDEEIGDTYIKTGPYIALQRNVEMYAWVETSKSSSETNLGGSETTTTTYDYSKTWTSSPQDSSNFQNPNGHSNPSMSVSDSTVKVKEAKVGVYDIDVASIALPGFSKFELNQQNTVLKDGVRLANGEYLFKGKGSIDSPAVGDIRIKYTYLQGDEDVTIFGKLDGQEISPFIGEKNSKLYQLSYGSSDLAISNLKSSHTMSTWFFRGLGFLMMWMGLGGIIAPISVILDVLPFLGSVSRGITGFATFIVAFVLSTVTIIVSMILHSLLAVIIAVIATGIIAFWFVSKRGKKKDVVIPQN